MKFRLATFLILDFVVYRTRVYMSLVHGVAHNESYVVNRTHTQRLGVPGFESRWGTMVILMPPGGGVLPYIRFIGMCRPKGYGFRAVLVLKWV